MGGSPKVLCAHGYDLSQIRCSQCAPIEVQMLGGGFSDGSGPAARGISVDYDKVAEELRKRQPPYVSLADDLKPLRKPAKDEVLVLQTDQPPAAFLEALHLVWPGVPVLVLPSDSKLTVQLVASLIDKLKALAARNELQKYDP